MKPEASSPPVRRVRPPWRRRTWRAGPCSAAAPGASMTSRRSAGHRTSSCRSRALADPRSNTDGPRGSRSRLSQIFRPRASSEALVAWKQQRVEARVRRFSTHPAVCWLAASWLAPGRGEVAVRRLSDSPPAQALASAFLWRSIPCDRGAPRPLAWRTSAPPRPSDRQLDQPESHLSKRSCVC